MMRCFVAVLLSPETRRGVAEASSALCGTSRGFRKVSAENLHITLQFLGELEESTALQVQEKLSAAFSGVSPFTLELAGCGAFPTARRPRVLWVGTRLGAPELIQLATRVAGALHPLGLRPDKPFAPHVTVARSRERTGPIQIPPLEAICQERIDAVHLVHSELLREGARYRSLFCVPLEPGEK